MAFSLILVASADRLVAEGMRDIAGRSCCIDPHSSVLPPKRGIAGEKRGLNWSRWAAESDWSVRRDGVATIISDMPGLTPRAGGTEAPVGNGGRGLSSPVGRGAP